MSSSVLNYHAYSTTFSSPVHLPGFATTTATPQVEISFGPAPSNISAPLTEGPLWTANRSEMLLSAPDLGRYYVSNGNSIVIDAKSRTNRLVTVLAGIPIASVLMQRGFLAIHAAAFFHPTLGAVAICGENGAGKSSLVTAMTLQGGSRICDNLGAVTTGVDSSGQMLLHQGPSSFRLWSKSARDFDLDPSKAERVSEDTDKYVFSDSPGTGTEPSQLKAIVCLNTFDEVQPKLTRLDDLSATASVADNHFRNDLARVMLPNWLTMISTLATAVPVYRLWRPRTECPPTQLADFLTNQLNRQV